MRIARLKTGTFASLVGLVALIMLSADVGQMHFFRRPWIAVKAIAVAVTPSR